jgi:hypothetical protein
MACALFGVAATAPALEAQIKLAGNTETGVGPVFEYWKFGSDGIPQPTVDGSANVNVTRATQWSIPLVVAVPIGSRWRIDLNGAYANSEVHLASADPSTGSDSYTLSGINDLRIRATGHIVGDNLLVTAGVNLPTGETEFDEEQLSALRVVSAPALSFQVPVLGTGGGGTLGVVLAKQLGQWAWAFGTSYEMRRRYTPIALAAGIPVDFSPGDAVHLSLGTSRLFGQHSMTFGVSADFYSSEELEGSTAAGATARGESQLGPIYTADFQFDVASSRFRELTFYAVERYRSEYEQNGQKTPNSSANYLDVGFRAVAGLAPSTGLLFAINGRHQTGLDSDDLLTTAAIASGSLTLGLQQRLAGNYSLQPFVRVQGGRLESGDTSTNVTGFSGGLTLGVRF